MTANPLSSRSRSKLEGPPSGLFMLPRGHKQSPLRPSVRTPKGLSTTVGLEIRTSPVSKISFGLQSIFAGGITNLEQIVAFQILQTSFLNPPCR